MRPRGQGAVKIPQIMDRLRRWWTGELTKSELEKLLMLEPYNVLHISLKPGECPVFRSVYGKKMMV